MKNNTIGRAGIFAMKLGFTAFGLLSIWILGGIAEHPGMWWLYALAAVGSGCIGTVLLGAALEAESNPDNPRTRIGGGR